MTFQFNVRAIQGHIPLISDLANTSNSRCFAGTGRISLSHSESAEPAALKRSSSRSQHLRVVCGSSTIALAMDSMVMVAPVDLLSILHQERQRPACAELTVAAPGPCQLFSLHISHGFPRSCGHIIELTGCAAAILQATDRPIPPQLFGDGEIATPEMQVRNAA